MKRTFWKIIHPFRAHRMSQQPTVSVPAETLARWEAQDLHVEAFLAANPAVAAKIETMKAAL